MTHIIPDSVNADHQRPEQDERTFTIPLTRRRAIGIVLRPGWWVILVAPLTIPLALAVTAYCHLSTRRQQQ